ncbi:MAG: hypothetical protein ACR652_24750 [Methylocystis sp.]|uniref:hypothetical protein n=1 Tax=Methylocystis sp. TaxID=1911079 RepID=UPI003DA53605
MSREACLRLAVAFVILVVSFPEANAASGRFDGRWTIEAIASGVACPVSKRNVVGVIVQNRVVQVSGLPVQGAVGKDGSLVASHQFDMGFSLHAAGRVEGASGSGAWWSSPGICSGTWHAHRSAITHAER